MFRQDRIQKVLFLTFDKVNEALSKDKKILKTIDAPLFNPQGHIDSLALTILIVSLEQEIKKEFGCQVNLVGNYLISDENSPFQTVKSLMNHINSLLPSEIHE